MRLITLALIATFASQPALGESFHNTCSQLSKAGENIAIKRYNGIPMRDQMANWSDNDLGQSMVRDAYDLPDYTTVAAKQQAVTDFGNYIYESCYDALENQ